ncbi:DUF1934 domain-containing protein [Sutcliffiella deserti]|uniref:DUF1934 domain-containing protein n=1 Tax=Sutcliffiella deserti TaxID=2875501 RepID=UPI001CBBEF4D|nr:DUF1934 domain-containing protein [Sutcliffiella deserti]
MQDNQKNEKMPVQVKFKSEILHEEQRQVMTFITNGQYYIKGETEYIVFTEELENKEKLDVIYKLTDKEVWVSRSGALKMRQSFRAGERTAGSLESEFGTFQLETDTEKIVRMKDPVKNRGSVQLQYNLKVQGEQTGLYFITIHYEEEQAE